ncbi:MAG TPA: UDP-N-acetylmuramate--L-alanine ligase [Acidimicrobiia bacterium]|nr:UDP-N-acetylmuramate--L-alanine ligase [Acidimicrobiia bacterium]
MDEPGSPGRGETLARAARVHLVGAGGAGMSALAKLLFQQGRTVTGSDLKQSPALADLSDLGIEVWTGSRPESAILADLVVASSAVPATDPELVAATANGVTVWQRPDLLGALTAVMPAIGVTGTHGKTSSTALVVTALRALGRDPSFVVGGDLVDQRTNAHLGETGLFVLEADEAFGTFLHLDLVGLVVTNVDAEHLEHYGDIAALDDAFASVVAGVRGPAIVGIDDPGGRRLAAATGAETYGTAPDAHWRIENVEEGPAAVRFRLLGPDTQVDVEVGRPGAHMARNAAGALALVGLFGMDVAAAAMSFRAFAGVRRRFEVRGEVGGVTLIDDYAHHPTEVAATLSAARRGPWRRVWAVFQPHLFSRTLALHDQFGAAFALADRVVVTDVFPAREAPIPGVTGELVAAAARRSIPATVDYLPHRADLARFIASKVEPGDVVLTMGAGDITSLPDELVPLLVERWGR